MSGSGGQPPKRNKPLPDGYEVLLTSNGKYDVMVKSKVLREMVKKASEEKRADLDALIRKYVQEGPASLPRSRFNSDEGWFPSDRAPGKIRLQAFKPWQMRAYGFCCDFNARPTFFITGIDPSKKQNDANQNILAAAGLEAVRVSQLVK